MNSFKSRLIFLALCFAVAVSAQAQLPMGNRNASDMNSAMLKLFGANTNFLAHAEVQVVDKNHKVTTTMPMKYDMLGNQTRLDIKFSEIKSQEVPPQFAAAMQMYGIYHMVTVMMPDQKITLSVCPDIKAYASTPMTKDEIESVTKDIKMTKTLAGKVTLDGHSCEKYNETLTDSKGATQQVTTWNALDLKGFPIQIQIAEDESTLTMKFKDIKLGRPDPALFAAPTGMTKFESMSALMTDAATKSLNPAKPR